MSTDVASIRPGHRRFPVGGRVLLACALIAGAVAFVRGGPQPRLQREGVDRCEIVVDPGAGRPGSRVVTVGVPLPEAVGVTDTVQLGVWREGGERMACQWRVLSRWSAPVSDTARPIRWALARFAAESGTKYRLRTGPGAGADAVAPPVARARDGGGFVVDTGRLRFDVPVDRFAPLAGLVVRTRDDRGVTFGRAVTGRNGLDGVLVHTAPDAEGVLVDHELVLSAGRPERVVLEENGPLRSVIRVDGTWRSGTGAALLDGHAGYTMRITADAGADSVDVAFTLRNDGLYGYPAELAGDAEPEWLFIRSLELRVPVTLGAAPDATVKGGSWPLAVNGDGAAFRLVQIHTPRHRADESRNFAFRAEGATADRPQEGFRPLRSGERSDGGLLLDDGRIGIFAGVRHFWQQAPAALGVRGSDLVFELLPREPGQRLPRDLERRYGDAYQFEGGRHKTYEVRLGFPDVAGQAHAAAEIRKTIVERRELALQIPAAARVAPAWAARSRAAGPMAVESDQRLSNADLAFAERHLTRMQRGLVDIGYCDRQLAGGRVAPISMITQRETRASALPGSELGLDLYGPMHFGDVAHAGGYASGHHDWVLGLHSAWLRLGDRAFLDRGREMLAHRVDIDQIHTSRRVHAGWRWINGLQRFPAGYHGGRSDLAPDGETTPSPARTWLEGLLLSYALTGETRAMEVARANADALAALYDEDSGFPAAADPGRALPDSIETVANSVEQLVAFHAFTGEVRYREAAIRGFRAGLLRLEEAGGSDGAFDPGPGAVPMTPLVRSVRALMRFHAELARAEGVQERALADRALALLVRVLAWLERDGFDGSGVLVRGQYVPLQLPRVRSADASARSEGYVPFDLLLADAFAYAGGVADLDRFRIFGARLFRDSVLFHQAPSLQGLPPGFHSRVSFSPVRYAAAETRPGAWLLGAHQEHLTRWSERPLALPLEGLLRVYGPDRPGFDRALRVVPSRTADTVPEPRRAPAAGTLPKRAPAGDTTPPPPVEPLVLDDADATFEGTWVALEDRLAREGTQRVALTPDADAASTFTASVPRSGRYQVSLWWGRCAGAAPNTRVEVRHANGIDTKRVNQSVNAGEWRLVGEYVLSATRPVSVRISSFAARGAVLADAVRIDPVE